MHSLILTALRSRLLQLAVAALLFTGSGWETGLPRANDPTRTATSHIEAIHHEGGHSFEDVTQHTDNAKPDLGSVSDNVYTNDSLGLTYQFPKAWYVDKKEMDKLNQESEAPSVRNNAGASASTPNSKNYTLLMVSQRPEETSCDECSSARVRGPRILLYSGVLLPSSGDQTPGALLDRIKPLLSHSPSVQIVREPEDCLFGGHAFSRMDTKWDLPGGGVTYSGDAVTFLRGFVIQFTIFADSPEQLEKLFRSLNSLQFKS